MQDTVNLLWANINLANLHWIKRQYYYVQDRTNKLNKISICKAKHYYNSAKYIDKNLRSIHADNNSIIKKVNNTINTLNQISVIETKKADCDKNIKYLF